jgi:hypothetical protein
VHGEYTHSLLGSIAEARACAQRLANGEQDVERNLVSFEVDESLPHHGFQGTRLDKVTIAITAQSVYRDALHVMKHHRSLEDLEEAADTLVRDDVGAAREEGPCKSLVCHFGQSRIDLPSRTMLRIQMFLRSMMMIWQRL